MRLKTAMLSVVMTLCTGAASADPIIYPLSEETYVSIGTGQNGIEQGPVYDHSALPDFGSTSVSVEHIGANVGGTLDLDPNFFSGQFDIALNEEFVPVQPGARWCCYASFSASVWFEVDVDSTYDISGWLESEYETGRYTLLQVILGSAYSGDLFRNHQVSTQTPNEMFVSGEESGDFQNLLVGSSTGVLEVGDFYYFVVTARIQTDPAEPIGMTGEYRMDIEPIPEPSAGLLIMAGLIGLSVRRKG